MKVLVVAGARPNFMKVAPILRELDRTGNDALLVHTGQHYDSKMSDAFFRDLDIREPDFHLGIGGGSHAQQTARIMEAFEPILLETRPDWLVVVGDVNSTLACALVDAKLQAVVATRVAHVEAGLRSGDWRMPEEVNRVLTDRLSDLLLTPSLDAEPNLLAEGVPAKRIAFVGNVMIDTLHSQLEKARGLAIPKRFGLRPSDYALVTLHRPSNVDDPKALETLLRALTRIRKDLPVLMPLHPRTAKQVSSFGLSSLLADILVTDPLGYTEMLSVTDGATVLLTDSGGLQEETTVLGVPCVTLREQTERPATILFGTNRLVPWPLEADGVYGAFREALGQGRRAVGEKAPAGWDGRASERIVSALKNSLAGAGGGNA